MRFIHTSDWHLGQTLHGLSREAEHRAFLEWLLGVIAEHAADALLVTGDVFDSQNPPVAAQKLLYEFLAEAKRQQPHLDVVIIGGNHDSATRLEAPNALLRPLDVHVVGSLPRDLESLLLPLTDRDGRACALVAAVPFLRLADLPAADGDPLDSLVEGVRAVYAEVMEAARARAGGLPLVVTGHCYMTGGALSELSERRILGGNQHALPIDLFPDECAYVALGHLHRPQSVGGRETVRYAGSPFPMSVTEKDYTHQVVLVELSAGAAACTVLPVPRVVDYLRVPATGAAGPERVLQELAAIDMPDRDRDLQPYLEVVVRLDAPAPALRHEVEQVLADKPVRLCRLTVEHNGDGRGTKAIPEAPDLATLAPEEVFSRIWARRFGDTAIHGDHLGAFRELLEAVQEGVDDVLPLQAAQ